MTTSVDIIITTISAPKPASEGRATVWTVHLGDETTEETQIGEIFFDQLSSWARDEEPYESTMLTGWHRGRAIEERIGTASWRPKPQHLQSMATKIAAEELATWVRYVFACSDCDGTTDAEHLVDGRCQGCHCRWLAS